MSVQLIAKLNMSTLHWIYKAHIFLVLTLYSAKLAFSLSTPRELSSSIEKRSAPSSALVNAFQRSFWIWSQDPNNPPVAPLASVAFRKTLLSSPAIQPATLNILITVDDVHQVYVDDVLVGKSPQSATWVNAQYYAVPLNSSLSTHVISVLGTNLSNGDSTFNPAALLAAIEIVPLHGSTSIITADSSWTFTKTIPSNWFSSSLNTSTWSSAKVLAQYGTSAWGSSVIIPTA